MYGYKRFVLHSDESLRCDDGNIFQLQSMYRSAYNGLSFGLSIRDVLSTTVVSSYVYCEVTAFGNIENYDGILLSSQLYIMGLCSGNIDGIIFEDGKQVGLSNFEIYTNKGRYRLKDGKFRDDSYRAVIEDDFIKYYRDDKLHRDDGPAIISKNGDKYWYKDGKLHREDGPAVELSDGDWCNLLVHENVIKYHGIFYFYNLI